MKQQILKEIVSDVISEMCFLYEETNPEQWDNAFDYVTWVDSPVFELKLYCTSPVATELTANFLGMPDAPEETDVTDSLNEILNMILGRFIGLAEPDFATLLPLPQSKKLARHTMETDKDGFLLFYSMQPLFIYYKEK